VHVVEEWPMIQVTSLNVHTDVRTVQTNLDIEHTSVGLAQAHPKNTSA